MSPTAALVLALVVLLLVCWLIASTITTLTTLATTKKCPACKERVKSVATKCKHCQEVFSQ